LHWPAQYRLLQIAVLKVISIGLTCLFIAQSAQACAIHKGLSLPDILQADIVIEAKVTRYYQAPDPHHPTGRKYTWLDVTDIETLHGDKPKTLSFTWQNWTFGYPEIFPTNQRFIFALKNIDNTGSATRYMPDGPTILSKPCGSSHIFATDSEIAQAVRDLFDGIGDPNKDAAKFQKTFHPVVSWQPKRPTKPNRPRPTPAKPPHFLGYP
jgi:hypothetical protein